VADLKLMSSKLECQLQERVLPWLFTKVDMFIQQDEMIN
jgi:hypothetical protein